MGGPANSDVHIRNSLDQIVDNFGADKTDDAAFTIGSSLGGVIMGVATTDQIDNGDQGAVAMTQGRRLKTETEGNIASGGVDGTTNPVKVGGKYNATLPTLLDGYRGDVQLDSRGRLITAGSSVSGSLTQAEHASPFDGIFVFKTNVTISCASADGGSPFSFTIDDTVCTVTDIWYKPTAGSWTSLTNTGSGVSISATSNVITVTGAGTPFAAGDSYKVGIDYQKKAYDLGTDTTKTTVQNPTPSYYQDVVPLIAAAQNVTTSWADLGFEIPCVGYKYLKLWLTIDINNATDFRIKILDKHTSAGSEEYPHDITKWTVRRSTMSDAEDYRELTADVDDLYMVEIELDNAISYIQVQIQAGVAGATAGQCDAAYYTLGY